jgi:hypothetical protein
MSSRGGLAGLGLLALACFALHCGNCVVQGRGADTLWACHVAAAAVGLGLLAGSATLVGIGGFWLAVGTPLWTLDVLGGAEFLLTSVLTHAGGLVLGLAGLRRLGVPRHVWWKALLALGALQLLCRWLTPPAGNVNAAFAVYSRFEGCFGSYASYELTLAGTSAVLFLALELGLRRLWPPTGAERFP